MNVLIVEDEILILRSLKRFFERLGHTVSTALSGQEAIQLIHNNDFDRILCDLMLQDTTGFDVIEESKTKYTQGQIKNKFVIMTAYSSQQVLENAQKYGCRVISKPFEDIVQTINSICIEQDEA
ncbi:MAG: hypothetical protein COW00_06215 [Bdellovibrio sp. CG12_big_fil_rev_8_21_14_0_65_39_13]|nr:MAG: hypothetical protein COW78_18750 [Bdellovibrio sp. CG22_combo_CG10-13_8_21_14_all_39_27]PIQ60817.1 MAG: hypothetical protein COW00_06215 [Bdellovibrio sp. CG12_big_fil_rev_8_21_14_0_65_39_13]PIR36441.1 MAG: hypothetical protein COV37_03555 [Bdellovibrio sp. CG11_big_fil_rev_8_21_14_0_20_39_38]PJB54667.1 MAG: hypothetical protein CO099_00345 [Bdellovibrio sp. CG_4_9_14_3_um_filter_39_7]